MRRSLATTLLALLATSAPSLAGGLERLDRSILPTFQTIDLVLDPERTDYTGTVRIELHPTVETDTIRLHSEDLELRTVRLVDRGTGEELPVEHTIDDEVVLTVRADRPLHVGRRLALEIDFANDYGTRSVGLYRVIQDGTAYLSTQFEADEAREAFPCFDQPEFKIAWRMSVETPAGNLAVANTPVARDSVEGGMRSVVFEQTPPLSSYHLAVAVGPWETVEVPGLGVPSRIVVPRGKKHLAQLAVDATTPILADLEAWFGTPYPFRKLDQIAVPEFAYGAMENPGAITYRDDILLLDPTSSSAGQRALQARVIAHELAHQWFGNIVTMEWWDDLWLNEAFADWMADASAHRVFPEYGIELSSLRSTEGTLNTDATAGTFAIRQPAATAEDLLRSAGLAYEKGKRVLGMVESWIGEDAFRNGVRSYIDAHQWSNTQAADLWAALGRASGENVSSVLRSFLDQPGLPLVSVDLDGEVVVLTQSRYAAPGADLPPQSWEVPIVLKIASGGTVSERRVVLSDTPLRLPLGAPADWVFPHAGARGWFRWSVPGPMLARIAEDAADALEPAERVALLGNALALLESGRLEAPRYFELLQDFLGDPETEVLRTALDGMGRVRQPLVTADLEDEWAAHVRTTVGPILARIGIVPRNGEPESIARLRPVLLTWLGHRGQDPGVRDFAGEEARAWLAGGTVRAPDLLGTTLEIAALDGDRDFFDALLGRFETADAPADRGRVLGALGGLEDPRLRDEALAWSLEGPLRPQEVLQVAIGIAGDEAGQDRALDWVVENFPTIRERVPPHYLRFFPGFADGCSRERLERGRSLFADLELDPRLRGAVEERFGRVAESVERCLMLRERHGAAAASWLAKRVTTHAPAGR